MALSLGSGEAAGEPLADGDGTWTLPHTGDDERHQRNDREARDLMPCCEVNTRRRAKAFDAKALPRAGGDARIGPLRE